MGQTLRIDNNSQKIITSLNKLGVNTIQLQLEYTEAIKEIAGRISGVEYVEVHVINDFFRQAAESFR